LTDSFCVCAFPLSISSLFYTSDMEQRTVTAVTAKMTTAQSRIRSELGNFPSGPTKFTVVHRRPVFFVPPQQQQSPQPTSGASVLLANAMCRFAHHPVAGTAQKSTAPECSRMSSAAIATTTTTSSSGSVLVSSQQQTNGIGKRAAADAVARQNSGSDIVKPAAARIKPILKRSLSADHLDSFQPVPAKRPFPVQIWFNNPPRGPRPLVATAFWLDSPLHDSQAFVYIKLLEASQGAADDRLWKRVGSVPGASLSPAAEQTAQVPSLDQRMDRGDQQSTGGISQARTHVATHDGQTDASTSQTGYFHRSGTTSITATNNSKNCAATGVGGEICPAGRKSTNVTEPAIQKVIDESIATSAAAHQPATSEPNGPATAADHPEKRN
jgi:hypothetical protein